MKNASEAEKRFFVRKNEEINITRVLEVVLEFSTAQGGIKLLNFITLDERNFESFQVKYK